MEKKFSDMIQTSAKGSMVLMVGRMISSIVSAIGTIFVARILGSQSYGSLSIALIPISIALLLVNNGSRSAIIKFLAEYRRDSDKEKINETIINGLSINVIIGFIVTFILIISSGFLANQVFKSPEIAPIIRILSITVFSQSLVATSTAVILGFEKMQQSVVIQIVQSIAKTLIGPILILMGFGLAGAALGYSLPFLISGCLALFLLYLNKREFGRIKFGLSIEVLKSLFVYTFPLFLANLTAGSSQYFYDFLLSIHTSRAIMGNYSAATSISVIIQFFISPISTATFPLLSKLKPSDPVFKVVYQNIIKYESMMIFPITFAVIALSDQIVGILYGPTYDQASLFMQLFVINFLFVGIGRVINISLLDSQRETKVTFKVTLIQLILGVPMGLIMIPRFGVLGYIVIQLTAPKIGLLYSLFWIKKNYNVTPDFRNVLKLFISSIFGFLSCVLFLNVVALNPWIELIGGGVIVMGVYFILILASGALSKENLLDIQKLFGDHKIFGNLVNPIFNILINISRTQN